MTKIGEIGQALMEIRDSHLYRAQHPTFEVYVKARWGFTKQWAYQQIEAAEVFSEVKTSLPSVEHAHLLAPLSPDEQRVMASQLAGLTVREAREVVANYRGNGTALPHIAQNTGESEWYTPKDFLEVARSDGTTLPWWEDPSERTTPWTSPRCGTACRGTPPVGTPWPV